MAINIAIDGPAGAGKSTVSRAVAKELGFIYVDTGALYRAVGLNALRLGVDTKDAEAVANTLRTVQVKLAFVGDEQRVFLNEEDVSEEIRKPEASMAASDVSAIKEVRDFLFDLQRDIAAKNDCLMDGRDIGTVVLPDAQIKIFLTASAEERARRRFIELQQKGWKVSYESVLDEMKQRDFNDSNREIAPLKPAEDSIIVSTDGLNLEEGIAKVLQIVRERL
ncbi:MAG TPA: (d)CMP kinase [Clostridiales bacterium]|nr:(d)CMP kinase [Clostridiales bacterium]HRT81956.1 (d)CMP kinase [Oscillospiraceae bacterium]